MTVTFSIGGRTIGPVMADGMALPKLDAAAMGVGTDSRFFSPPKPTEIQVLLTPSSVTESLERLASSGLAEARRPRGTCQIVIGPKDNPVLRIDIDDCVVRSVDAVGGERRISLAYQAVRYTHGQHTTTVTPEH
ncbi:MAG TPA: hypothetical protein VHB25_08415 [Gemmatimonadaceae bacterium]|nr:hypothetical protein [Gemmatimonadaceae bacterium]